MRTTEIRAVKVGALKTESGMMGSCANLLSQARNAMKVRTESAVIIMTYGIFHPTEGAWLFEVSVTGQSSP